MRTQWQLLKTTTVLKCIDVKIYLLNLDNGGKNSNSKLYKYVLGGIPYIHRHYWKNG